jgi:anhydro-N-acetylmuramic acid kinase
VEYFNLRWLEAAAQLEALAPNDIQATLSELTAQSVAASVPATISNVLVCGGGVNNTDLLDRLRAALPGRRIESTMAHGIDPKAVEAVLFAWLARERLAGHPQDTPSITGADRAVLLGSIHRPAQSGRHQSAAPGVLP